MSESMINPIDDLVALNLTLSKLALANRDIALQIAEQAVKAAKSVLATKKLADDLTELNKQLAIENKEKIKLAAELSEVNKRLESEINKRERQTEQILHTSLHDSLTKLATRSLLTDHLNQAFAANRRSGCNGALLFIDWDNFKVLNDTHGHYAGDLLLIEVGKRLTACVRLGDTVARLGGDEFVVLVTDLNKNIELAKSSILLIAEEIRLSLAKPSTLELQDEGGHIHEVECQCTASIGVVLFNAEIDSGDKVLARADHAMYRAKEAGRNRIEFSES